MFKSLINLAILGLILLIGLFWYMFSMPGESHQDAELPPLNDHQKRLKQQLKQDVEQLANGIGPRSLAYPKAYERSRRYIEKQLERAGYIPTTQRIEVGSDTAYNIIATKQGSEKPDNIVLVGAHYDTATDTAGADDNASGVAGALALARGFQDRSPKNTLRFVFFANEEPPYFQTPKMGSYQYAERAREESENIVAMLSLEMIGYYSDEPGSQSYPLGLDFFYPSTGNFITFIGKLGQRSILSKSISTFRECSQVPSYGIAGPTFLSGISFSDHWSFWQHDFPAVMVTDTAFFRNPHYHQPTDTADTLDYNKYSRVVSGVDCLLKNIAH
jgi:Zn-dependent M28 family amino/carboxypeptidase